MRFINGLSPNLIIEAEKDFLEKMRRENGGASINEPKYRKFPC